MKSKFILLLITSILTTTIYSQSVLDEYKYVIVQKQFHFQAEPNQYDLNRIVKYLFEDQGFKVVVEGQSIPEDLRSNFCLALNSDVRISGLLRTKATVFLRNCEGKVVYQTEEGVTKEKEHKRAYNIAIHKTFESFNSINYKYQPKKEDDKTSTEVTSDEVVTSYEAEEATMQEADASPQEVVEKTPVKVETVSEMQSLEESSNVEEASAVAARYKSDPRQLFAKKTDNGYELTYNSKTVMTMIETSLKEVFLVKGEDAMIYKEDGKWLYSDRSAKNNEPVVLNLKFLPQ